MASLWSFFTFYSTHAKIQRTIFEKKEIIMETGCVKWFHKLKGYGFIESEHGKSFFVHFSNLNMVGYKSLEVGQKVHFEIAENKRGLQAVNVTKIYSWYNPISKDTY